MLILPIEDGSLGESIIEIIVLYKPLHNYSVQNKLFKTQWVEVTFEDQTVKGQIVNADDVIEILLQDKTIYIPVDRGLPKGISIKKISRPYREDEEEVVPEIEPEDSPNGELLGYIEEEDTSVQYFYSIEQQTSDLLEHLMMYVKEEDNTPKLKNKMFKMIQRYKELRTKYTIFKDGIFLNKLPSDQMYANAIELATKIYEPVSKDITVNFYDTSDHAVYFRKVENDEGDMPPSIYELSQLINSINNEANFDKKNKSMNEIAKNHNFQLSEKKRRRQYTPRAIQDVYLYENPNLLVPMTPTIKQKNPAGEFITEYVGVRKRYMTRVDKPFLIHSLMMSPIDFIKYSKVYDLRSSMLDKINLNQNQYYSIFYNGKLVKVNKPIDYNLLNKYTYYENGAKSYDIYLKHIIPSFKKMIQAGINTEIIQPFYNLDDFISNLSVTNINELKYSELITATAYLKGFVNDMVQRFKTKEQQPPNVYKFINTIITNKMSIAYDKLMPKELMEIYFSSSELFKIGALDNYQYYKSQFIKDQGKLKVTDEEIKQMIEEIKVDMKEPVEETIAIVYKTEEERIQDSILLKQVGKKSGIEHIYSELIKRGIDVFSIDELAGLITELKVRGYKPQNGMKEHTQLILYLITEIKIIEGDKAYVEESKTKYSWDGTKWIDEKGDPTCLIKRKLYNGDCATAEKEREYNERISRLVFNIEQEKRREEEREIVNVELEESEFKSQLASFTRKHIKSELKYNTEKNAYGVYERLKDSARTEVSGYTKLRDKILSEPDLNFKYKAMQIFIQKYTKRGNDPNWFYCIETSVKLLPTFFSKLADAYLRTDNYEDVISILCNEQGTLSDNGDKWVDKYSGYIIKEINFEEEYGLEVVANEKEKPLFDEVVVEELQLQREINQNLKSLFFYLGVYPDETDLYPRIINSYNEISKDKPESQLVALRLLCIMAHALVYIQTSDIKQGKPYPNCKRSFEGYPIDDTSNLGGVKYIACVVVKLSKTAPWKIFSKLDEDSLVKKIVAVLLNFVVPMVEVQDALIKKRMVYHKQVELVTTDWKNFSPRLKKYNMLHYETPRLNSLTDCLDATYYTSYILQQLIHKHVSEQEFLLKDSLAMPYLVNTCCHTNNNVFRYFKEHGTKPILEKIRVLVQRIYIYKSLLLGTRSYFVENTRTLPTEPSSAFDEKTIHLKLASWVNKPVYARFGLQMPEFNPSDTMDKKIEKITQMGSVSLDTFVEMLKYTSTVINTTRQKNDERIEKDKLIHLDDPKVKDILYSETETIIDKLKGNKTLYKVLMFNRTCKSNKMNLVIDPKIEHYTHMNEILYNKINALLYIFPEMIKSNKTILDKVERKHWLLADAHNADITNSVAAYYNGIISLPKDGALIRDIDSIPLDRYKNLMKFKISNQETLNLFYHYIFVHIISDLNKKSKNIDSYLECIISIFEREDKVLNYDTESIEYQTKLSKKSETQIKTDYFKQLSLEERKSENVMKEHKLDKWGVGLQKSMFKYDKSTYSRDKESAIEVINGLNATELDEEPIVNEEEGYDTREPAEDDDDVEYEEED